MMGEGKDPIFYADTLNKFAFIKRAGVIYTHAYISPSTCLMKVYVECNNRGTSAEARASWRH